MDTKRLKKLCKQATPGPWFTNASETRIFAGEMGRYVKARILDDDSMRTADAEFIAAAREGVPELLALLDHASSEIKRLDATVDCLKRERDALLTKPLAGDGAQNEKKESLKKQMEITENWVRTWGCAKASDEALLKMLQTLVDRVLALESK